MGDEPFGSKTDMKTTYPLRNQQRPELLRNIIYWDGFVNNSDEEEQQSGTESYEEGQQSCCKSEDFAQQSQPEGGFLSDNEDTYTHDRDEKGKVRKVTGNNKNFEK